MHALHPSLLVLCSVALLACEQAGGPSEPESHDDPPPIAREGQDASKPDLDAGPMRDVPPIDFGHFDANFVGFDATTAIDLGRDAGAPPLRLSELRSAPKPPPAISGGTLAVDKAGTVAVIGDSDRDLIYVVDLTTAAVRKLTLPGGSEPGRVALEGTKAAHVALRGTGEVAHVELATGAVQRSAVCSHPRGVAFDAAHGRIVVACLDGQLVQLDATTRKVAAHTSDLPNDLRDVILGANGVEALTRHRSAELLRLDADLHVQASVRPRNGARLGFGASVLPAPSVTDNTKAAPSPGGSLGGVAAPSIAPTRTFTLSPALAWRALRAASGNVWMLHQQSQDDQVVISQAGGYGGNQNGPCSAITGGKVSEFGPDGSTARSMAIQLFGLSVDAALSPNAKWLAVASPGAYARGNSTLQVYATDGMQTTEAPGDCRPPAGLNGGESQITSIAYDDNNVLYAFSRDPAELTILLEPTPDAAGVQLTRKATIALELSSVRDTGHDLFHADVGQGIACASCHGEALDDAHVWNFEKIGPRRTQNMRGGLLATAPFHWDGDMMSMGHLVDEVMTRRMGGFQVPAAYVQALGSWIDRQPALTLPASDEAAVARGKALFSAAGTQCATCHSGASFTNNESRNVGTGGVFQVPGLRGLALRAPYMHSGCAKTLEERFTPACGGGDQHGVTSNLSASQIADLVAYLKTL